MVILYCPRPNFITHEQTLLPANINIVFTTEDVSLLKYIFTTILLFIVSQVAFAQPILHVYGPGGPFPAMKAAAKVFSKKYHVDVVVQAGPLPKWKSAAMNDADLIYSGSENMMTDYLGKLTDLVDAKTIMPAYLRPAAILVHTGNPKHIRNFRDLLKPGISVMVVQGAGQTGLWEDIAGKNGNIQAIRNLRKNIVVYAPDSASALVHWTSKHAPDAWIIYNIWQVAHPKVAEMVKIGPRHILYRDMDMSLTQSGRRKSDAIAFYHFVMSPEGATIFKRWGWQS